MKFTGVAVLSLCSSMAMGSWIPGLLNQPEDLLNLVDSFVHPKNDMRLVEFDGGKRSYHSEEQLLEFLRQGRRFMDITEHQEADSVSVFAQNTTFPAKAHYSKVVHHLASNLTRANLESNLEKFTSFWTRYARSQDGLESSLWLADQIKAIASIRDDVSVELFNHSWLQKSVIARIEGKKNPEKVVVVGAHLDSLNLILPSVLAAPGADDNGSGTVTILEVFRVLVESGFTPENTVEFHWYSAEELGLLGSQDVFAKYNKDQVDVRSMLQQDCTGYSAGTTKDGSPDSLGLITDFVHEGLTNYLKVIVDTYCDIPYVETTCGYACSDHASASKYGYPSAFVIESEFAKSNPHMHTTEDTIDKLDFDHMLQHAKLTLGYAFELGFAEI